MTEGWVRVYLGVGSSLDPEKNIPWALSALRDSPGIEVESISTFYRTPPLPAPGAPLSSVAADPSFLNGVLGIQTILSTEELTLLLADLEDASGRVRTDDSYAPRTLDLDILLYLYPATDPRREDRQLTVHKDVRTRPWVALPLFELDPGLLLPPDGTPLAEIAAGFPDPGGVRDPLSDLLTRDFLCDGGGVRSPLSGHPEYPMPSKPPE